MTRVLLRKAITAKSFYVVSYRQLGKMIFFSLVLNGLLFAAIVYVYMHMPPRSFYATNGVTPPIELTPLLAPNTSDTALLPPASVIITKTKVIPD